LPRSLTGKVNGDSCIVFVLLEQGGNDKFFGERNNVAAAPCGWGFGPRLPGANAMPLFASISASQSFDPTGDPRGLHCRRGGDTQ
jgi:hypothetical protein